MSTTRQTIDPKGLWEMIQQKKAQAIDVREAVEYRAAHIPGSVNLPLSQLPRLLEKIDSAETVYLICKSGSRSNQAAEIVGRELEKECACVEGGLDAWRGAGLPVEEGVQKVWALDRQVRFAAGTLVLAGVILSLLVHPGWIGLSAFVGCGLIFSGVTNTCGMALMLARMPWNRVKEAGE